MDLYVLGETFEGENFCELVKIRFSRRNFRGLLAFAVPKDATPQISRRKLSRIATKLRNSRKFSPPKVSVIVFTRIQQKSQERREKRLEQD